MVYYDADEDLERALDRLGQAVPPGANVLVRYKECADEHQELARLVDDFTRRFGTAPAWSRR